MQKKASPSRPGARPKTSKPSAKPARPGARPARPAAKPETRSAKPASRPAKPQARPAAKPAPRKREAEGKTGNTGSARVIRGGIGGDAERARRAGGPPRPGSERLQKLLAHAGIDSRRACEALILEGRVQVNGVTVTELGTKADPERDEITVDFVPIHKEPPVYLLLNKPKGYVTTVRDDQGRPTVMALVKGVPGRLYPVGRLDFNSEGLLLLTNDGALAQVLTGPDHEIPKVYLVKVHRMPTPEQIKELSEGFRLDGRRLKPCRIEIFDRADNPWLKVTLTEGKNLQIRRMFAAIGHPVSKLRRVQFGPLTDPALKPGAWRFLAPNEIAALKAL